MKPLLLQPDDSSVVSPVGIRRSALTLFFGTVNAIDCRSENTLYVGDVGNFRIQMLTIR